MSSNHIISDGHYEVTVPNGAHYVDSLTLEHNVTLVVSGSSKFTVSRDLYVYGNLWIYYQSTLNVNRLAEIWGELHVRGGEKRRVIK